MKKKKVKKKDKLLWCSWLSWYKSRMWKDLRKQAVREAKEAGYELTSFRIKRGVIRIRGASTAFIKARGVKIT